MGPTSKENTQTPRRQSCDRCHNQKVRCTRTDNRKTGACDRCLRKDVLCTYSSCLPKGRPSLYRTSEVSTGSESPSKAVGASWTPPETVPGTPKSEVIQPILPTLSSLSRPDQQQRDITPFSHTDAEVDRDNDIDMDAHGDSGIFPGSTEALSDFWASWWPQDHIGDNMLDMNPTWALNLDPALDSQPPASLGFSELFPHYEEISTANSDRAGHGHTGEEGFRRGNDYAENSNKSSSSNRAALTTDKSDFELSIAHLSQLSTRLSQLLGSSRSFLAEALDPSHQSKNHDPVMQVQLGIEAVFKSVNAWLVHGTGNTNLPSNLDLGPTDAFDLPHHVFSASNHLLGILRHIRLSTGTSAPSPSTSSSISSGSYAETSPSDASHHSSTSVVHHLVLVCVTLLLNMYVAILIALQRSADALNSSPRPRANGDSVEPNDHMDDTSRVRLQLVSVVELCSHFIKRQNQTVDLIMSNSQGPLQAPSSGGNDSRQSASFDNMSALRTEVKQRLRQLQESLLYNPLA